MTNSNKRFFQIYTGNGKGKTTAALGQTVRAAGSELRTFIVMFMKEYPYGEVRALEHLSEWITIERHGKDDFVYKRELPSDTDKAAIQTGLQHAREAMLGGKYDIVILDEICVCTYFKLIEPMDLLPILDEKPDSVELILTGRYCPQEWIDRADLVTEMQEVKHYYQQGVLSRKGFES
jgi:cob(I)alamin adenosyltransferase